MTVHINTPDSTKTYWFRCERCGGIESSTHNTRTVCRVPNCRDHMWLVAVIEQQPGLIDVTVRRKSPAPQPEE